MPVTTSNALDALLFIRNGDTTARWNFPAAVGSSWQTPAGVGTSVTLTYSFLSASPAYYDQSGVEQTGIREFTPIEKAATRQVLASIASMVNVVFQEVQGIGQLTYAMSSQDPLAGAFAFIPSYSYVLSAGSVIQSVTESQISGDVWFNGNIAWTAADWQAGGNGHSTLLHETGHALGLKHPFEAPANGYVLNPALDTERHTVMSYTLPSNTDIVQVSGTQFSYSYTWAPLRPSTLMLLDIEALQALYGANTGTRSGNDTYTWTRNAEILETLWDGGGIDVIDCSNQTLSCLIDLRAGNYSSIALRRTDAQKRAALDLPPWFNDALPTGTYDGRNNLAIAKGVVIENASGGSAADVITGNAQANVLIGGGGNDVLSGLGGNDTLNGGAGSDTMRGGLGDDLYFVAQAGDVVDELAGQGIDQINSVLADFTLPDFVENGRIISTGSADLGGNDLGNTLFAGAGNNDLKGRGGVDTVSYAFGLSGTTGVLVDLQTGLEQNTGGSGLDTLSSIENLIGSARADTLIGNADANTLRGGLGQDSLNGLGGADRYVFDTAPTLGNRDRVIDFVSGVDKLVLDDDIFTVLTGSVAGTALPAGFFRVGSAPLDADDYFLYTPNTDILWYAPSANATINLLPVAVIPMGNLTPLASDFLVIA